MENVFDSSAIAIFKIYTSIPMNDKGILPHLLSPEPQMGMFLLPAFDLGIFRAYISAFHCKQANRFS